MRYLALVLSALLILIQYPLWVGKGGWNHVWELEGELAEQERANAQRRLRNAALAAEVADLKSGTAAVEELARMQLGMVKPGELFIHVSAPDPVDAAAPANLARTGVLSAGSAMPVVAAAR